MNPLWLCLEFPEMAVDAIAPYDRYKDYDRYENCNQHEDQCRYFAVSERQQIIGVSAAAQTQGVQAGITVSSALTLLPNLAISERQPDKEQERLEAIAQWGYRFTPEVCLYQQPSYHLRLQIGGSIRLFRSLDNLLQQVHSGLDQWSVQYRSGLGHTPLAAYLLCQQPQLNSLDNHGKLKTIQPLTQEYFFKALGKTPIDILPFATRDRLSLQQMGLRTLADLQTIPRGDIAQRFKASLLDTLDQITGQKYHAERYISPPKVFLAHKRLNQGVENLEHFYPLVIVLIEELCRFLQLHQLRCLQMLWTLDYTNKQHITIELSLSDFSQSVRSLYELTRLKFETLTLAAPVETVNLRCDRFSQLNVQSMALFSESAATNNDRQQLLDKLKAKLGEKAIHRLQLNDCYLPEQQSHSHPISSYSMCTQEGKAHDQKTLENRHPAPLWVLNKPRPLYPRQGQLLLNSGQPLTLLGSRQRIDSHWWQQRQRRDYYLAEEDSGALHWVYFDHRKQTWFLHGHFG